VIPFHINKEVDMKKILSILILSLNCEAAVYKWVDKAGTVHYAGIKPFKFKALELPMASYSGTNKATTSTTNNRRSRPPLSPRSATFVEELTAKENNCERYQSIQRRLQEMLSLPHSALKGVKLRREKKQYLQLLKDCKSLH